MGMFDNINFEIKCPNCKTKVDDFQSKDSVCLMCTLEFWEVNNFYASCPECKTWIEFTLKESRPNRKLTIKDYKKEVEIPSKKEQQAHKKKYQEFAKLLTPKQKEVKKLKWK